MLMRTVLDTLDTIGNEPKLLALTLIILLLVCYLIFDELFIR